MNDDFLSRFRQAPRPEFTDALYAQLNQNAKIHQRFNRGRTAKRLAFSLAALCLAFALTMAVSPAVRAAVSDIIAKITVRGTTVLVTEETPVPAAEYESYSLVWTPATPEEISANYSFYAQLPTWLPSGYTLQERAALYYGSMFDESPFSALFEWKHNAGAAIQLEVTKGACPNGPSHDPASGCTLASFMSVGLGSEPEIVAINDQPAILYRGVTRLADLSGSTRKWNPSRWKSSGDVTKGWSMAWEKEGRTYFLAVESLAITKEDLIRLAESVPLVLIYASQAKLATAKRPDRIRLDRGVDLQTERLALKTQPLQDLPRCLTLFFCPTDMPLLRDRFQRGPIDVQDSNAREPHAGIVLRESAALAK